MKNGMPRVSIVVPCLNEESTIEYLLQAITDQDFNVEDLEIVIADGLSTDSTRQKIELFQRMHPGVTILLVDNPDRVIPAGLNRAINASSGDYIIRLDAHSVPARDYVSKCVARLDEDIAENVGGVWQIQPRTNHWVGRSIAAAAGHPIGVGDARYRYGTKAGYVDTVPFGAFKREVFANTGLFNEKLLSNEDYEFNARIRANGGRIWFDPQIQSIYFARNKFLSLMKQYFRYGYWKWLMLRNFPKTLRWRQALPPLFVLWMVFLLAASPWIFLARCLTAVTLLLYAGVLLAASIPFAVKNRLPSAIIGVPLSIAIMHFSWGAGFLWSMVKSVVRG